MVPDANWFVKLPYEFWQIITKKLNIKGYDVFVNTTELNIAEALYLAQISKGIIGLRCGFIELMSMFDVTKHIIYTSCKWNTIPQIKNVTTLLNYPFVKPETIFEYEQTDGIIDKILGEY